MKQRVRRAQTVANRVTGANTVFGRVVYGAPKWITLGTAVKRRAREQL